MGFQSLWMLLATLASFVGVIPHMESDKEAVRVPLERVSSAVWLSIKGDEDYSTYLDPTCMDLFLAALNLPENRENFRQLAENKHFVELFGHSSEDSLGTTIQDIRKNAKVADQTAVAEASLTDILVRPYDLKNIEEQAEEQKSSLFKLDNLMTELAREVEESDRIIATVPVEDPYHGVKPREAMRQDLDQKLEARFRELELETTARSQVNRELEEKLPAA